MPKDPLENLNPREFIIIKGAKVHNLKNVDLAIPHRKLTVVTGLSGSGKSSLAFDTLYAEGQRRYVESLSSYARQFLGRLDKPEVEYIKGISPAVAIEQKVTSRNPRSTVGTNTEIYDYLKVLYARIGKTISPVSGIEVKRHSVEDVVNYVSTLPAEARIMVKCPIKLRERSLEDQLSILEQQGYARIAVNKKVVRIEEADLTAINPKKDLLEVVVDRLIADTTDEDNRNRLADSIQTAFFEGHGTCVIYNAEDESRKEFSSLFEADGIEFEEPSIHLFSFNNPYGACPKCEGFGSIIGIDEDLVIPDSSLSLYQDTIAPWRGEKMRKWRDNVIEKAEEPFVRASILIPERYMGAIMNLCLERRGENPQYAYPTPGRIEVTCEVPLAEVIYEFYDKLKTVTQGYGSFDYDLIGYRVSDLIKLDILVNGEKIDAFSMMIHRERARPRALHICNRLKDEIPRHMFKIAIQGAIGGTIIARSTIPAFRKDVTAKCYGGDISRKRKLLEKQKKGKKRMKMVGSIEIPQKAFVSVFQSEEK